MKLSCYVMVLVGVGVGLVRGSAGDLPFDEQVPLARYVHNIFNEYDKLEPLRQATDWMPYEPNRFIKSYYQGLQDFLNKYDTALMAVQQVKDEAAWYQGDEILLFLPTVRSVETLFKRAQDLLDVLCLFTYVGGKCQADKGRLVHYPADIAALATKIMDDYTLYKKTGRMSTILRAAMLVYGPNFDEFDPQKVPMPALTMPWGTPAFALYRDILRKIIEQEFADRLLQVD